MDPSKLADRLRGILNPTGLESNVGSGTRRTPPTSDVVSGSSRTHTDLEHVLGGEWRPQGDARCFVVERRFAAQTLYGRVAVGELAAGLETAAGEASLIAGGRPARPPFIFFDLETTGLSGGAGTYAFLVGFGWFDADGGFLTRQYVLVRFADERPLQTMVAAELARAGAIVSFNGKSFDAPVLETRYLFHRLEWVGARQPHIDVLHPARRFWGGACGPREDSESPFNAVGAPPPTAAVSRVRARQQPQALSAGMRASDSLELGALGVGPQRHEQGGAPRALEKARCPGASDPDRSSCSLVSLERQVLGARRAGDVAGPEIPARYFQFVRSGDARPLAAVLDHNRLDLLALAGLTARLVHLVRSGPDHAGDAREALALGHVYARAGLDGRARDAFARAASVSIALTSGSMRSGASIALASGSMPLIRIDALRALALAWRRARQYDEAAGCWRQLLDARGCPRHIAREATEALAIHHEHRVRDLAAAKAFARRNLEHDMPPASHDAARYRLARIERKMANARRPGLLS